ncbi:unnamed protein product, partial [Owenia fusiformis]
LCFHFSKMNFKDFCFQFMMRILRSRILQVLIFITVIVSIYLFYQIANKSTFTSETNNIRIKNNLDPISEKGNDGKNDRSDRRISENVNEIDVIVTFTKAEHNYALRDKFKVTVSSLLKHSTIDIKFHIIGDEPSQKIAKQILDETIKYVSVKHKLIHHDVDAMAKQLHEIVKPMQKYFSYKPGAYYSDALFFLSIAIHRVLPDVQRVIMLDADLKFRGNIKDLYMLFGEFAQDNVIGIAREMQPVYRHLLNVYRNKHPNTRAGAPPPDGLTGFNSGVMLLDLDRMRQSELYNSLINQDTLKEYTEKYTYKGHLGDQDFFSLINLEHEELFYVLPCTWNRQLCTWWRENGYKNVFNQYFTCEGYINIYHGNCNTPIPDD